MLVLSFLLRYGLSAIYRQQNDMDTYIEALNQSAVQGDGSSFRIQDVHIPNPADTFGIGDRATIQAGQSVTWNNVTAKQIKEYMAANPRPYNMSVKFNTNYKWKQVMGRYLNQGPRPPDEPPLEINYTIAAKKTWSGGMINVTIPSLNIINQPVSGADLKIVENPVNQEDSLKVLLLNGAPISPGAVCESQYCETEKFDSADIDGDGSDEVFDQLAAGGGGGVGSLTAIDYQEGQIEQEKMQPGPDNPPENVTGFLSPLIEDRRQDTLQVQRQGTGGQTSTNTFNGFQAVHHPVKKTQAAGGGTDDLIFDWQSQVTPQEKWTTPP
jgi:hypothetical protein